MLVSSSMILGVTARRIAAMERGYLTTVQKISGSLLTEKFPCLYPLPRQIWSQREVWTVATYFEAYLHEETDK